MGIQNLRYSHFETPHHVSGSRDPGLGQPVLDAKLLAQPIELIDVAGSSSPMANR